MKHLTLVAAVLLLLLAGCAAQKAPAPEKVPAPPAPTMGIPADHPEMTEQETYQPCSECHREVTPEIVDQWWNSGHGIGNVKCYQCHGTFENMMKVPAVANCMTCHEKEVSNMNGKLGCWQCHPAHGFSGHKGERGEG